MPEYTVPYYQRLRYYHTMLEMTADWWGAQAEQEIEQQGGKPTQTTQALLASSTLADELMMLEECIEDYESLPPARAAAPRSPGDHS